MRRTIRKSLSLFLVLTLITGMLMFMMPETEVHAAGPPLTISGANKIELNGIYTTGTDYNGKAFYWGPGGASSLYWTGSRWELIHQYTSYYYSTSTSNGLLPPTDGWRLANDSIDGDFVLSYGPTFSISPSSVNVNEATGFVQMTITLSEPFPFFTSVDYITSDGSATAGSDYFGGKGTAYFNGGDTSVVIGFTIINDSLYETHETFMVTLYNPSAGATIGAGTSTVTIVSDDPIPTIGFVSSTLSVYESDASASLGIKLSNPSSTNASVTYTTSNVTAASGSDYQAKSGMLTINAGVTSGTIAIPLTDDTSFEGNETFVVTLSSPSGAVLGASICTVTILDNDILPVITTSTIDKGVLGTLYLATLVAVGDPPISWRLVSGSLPAGISLSANGVLSGTPTAAGSFDFTVEAKNNVGIDTESFRLVINEAPTITTAILANGIVGSSYDAAMQATGDLPMTWTLSTGSLPPGLTMTAAGVLSGTPTAAGTYKFTVQAENAIGTDTQALSLVINEAPTITTTTLGNGVVGNGYNATLLATGDLPITWTVNAGTLPAGLILNPSTGTIFGIPTTAGTYDFTVQAENATGTDLQAFSLVINEAPTITTTILANGIVGSSYDAAMQATGDLPITWELIAGSLPPGLTLTTGGVLSGMPTTAGTYDFTVQAENATGTDTQALSLVINQAPTIISTTLGNGVVGNSYNAILLATGDMPITWTVNAGTLPAGLALNSSTGTIFGIPTAAGTYDFTTQAENATGTDTQAFSLVINEAPTITTAILANGIVGSSYDVAMQATGDLPMTWTLSTGSLPPGLTVTTDGVLSGAPTTAGTYEFTVQAENTIGTDTQALSLVINEAPTITTTTLGNGVVGNSYSATLLATGDLPMTWTVDSGNLPTGLTLTAAGVLSGTPTTAGAYEFTVQAENATGTDTQALSLVINEAPTITTAILGNGIVGGNYDASLLATGDSPVTWTVTAGSLPAGLTMSATGVLSGTPTTAGTYEFTVQAENAIGTDTQALSLVINEAPTITTTTLGNGVVGSSYSATLVATGDLPMTWTVDSGNLPTGLTLTAAGVLSGTPTTAGIYEFTVQAENATGMDTQELSLVINEAPTITTAILGNGVVGDGYSVTLLATGDHPMTWTVNAGILPAGLTLNSSSGVISGTPTIAGTYEFIVQAENATGTDTQALSLVIDELTITDLPETYTMAVGGTVTWNPLPTGGTWSWDEAFFTATFNSPATFTALKSGTTTITYTFNQTEHQIVVTIEADAIPVTGETSQSDIVLLMFMLLIGLVWPVKWILNRRRSYTRH